MPARNPVVIAAVGVLAGVVIGVMTGAGVAAGSMELALAETPEPGSQH